MILPKDFTIEKYGLFARFVEERDAEFILSLRTDKRLSRYLNPTDNDVNKQKEWIKAYKEREAKGEDYYFIFFKNDEPLGLNRMYNIHGTTFTTGSWLFKQGAPFESSILASIIVRELAYEKLGMELEDGYDGCHVDNKQVLKFQRMMGLHVTGVNHTDRGDFEIGYFVYKDFSKGRDKMLKLLGYNV